MGTIDWRDQSACLDEDPEMFAVHTRGAMNKAKAEAIDAAKAVCGRCDVKAECLARALALGIDAWGVWGGTTDTERARIRKVKAPNQPEPAPKLPPTEHETCGRYSGYHRHHEAGEKPCTRCLLAKSDYARTQRANQAARREAMSA